MSDYNEDDRQRDMQTHAGIALIAAALSAPGARVSMVLARSEKMREHLNATLPPITIYPAQQCQRTAPHRRHRWYTELDDRAQCEGVPA